MTHHPTFKKWLSRACLLIGAGCLAAAVVPSDAQAADDYSGRYVMLQHTVTRAEVPVVGTILATARVVNVLDLKHKRGRLRGKGQLCSLDLDSGSSFVKTIIPDAFKRALPPPRFNARLKEVGGKLKLKQKRQVVVVGAKLDKPKRDKMPTRASDKRVFDQDGDGHPGVTIQVEGIVSGEMYVVQRSWTLLSGRRLDQGMFGGRVYFGNEQHILAATSSMLKDPPKARPMPNKSFFRMKRVDKGTTCAAAKELAAKWKRP